MTNGIGDPLNEMNIDNGKILSNGNELTTCANDALPSQVGFREPVDEYNIRF